LIGHTLAKLTGLPWIADFRDPMAQDGYPADSATWRSFKRIEVRTIKLARRCVFTTPGASRHYRARYPAQADRMSVIENGYDEDTFAGLAPRPAGLPNRRMVLLHSGIVYPSERDPTALFVALHALRKSGHITPETIILRFRASSHDDMLVGLATRYGVRDLIEVAPPLPYREALAEMLAADGLMILQAANCNEQIPAKLYEYLRAQRPILGLADPAGDTAEALRRAGLTHLAALEDDRAIASVLGRFVDDIRAGLAPLPDPASVSRASRKRRTESLVRTLESI
jgi:glycosyltransferase involved in cell wall biosynthesis